MATNKPKRKTYSDEFKEFLVQEAISSGRSIASIARDNGINQNLLHNWKRAQKAKQAQTNQLPTLINNDAYRNTPTFIPVSVPVFVNIVVTQFNIKRLKPQWH